MKIAHLADLHLGKSVGRYSMAEDQKYILKQIAGKAAKKEVDVVLIAGDIFDDPVPSEEAVVLLDEFLQDLRKTEIDVFLTAGEHDSGIRLEMGASLFEEMNIHITGKWKGKLVCTDLLDRYGPMHVWCLPYLTAEMVNSYIEEEDQKVSNVTEAIRHAIRTADIDWNERNILVAHQYVKGAVTDIYGSAPFADQAEMEVDPSVFEGFDYVALGHVHEPQSVGKNTVRYSGPPLNYTFSESERFEPGFSLVFLGEKGDYRISTILLEPAHPLETFTGTLDDLMTEENRKRYAHSILRAHFTDRTELGDRSEEVRKAFPFFAEAVFQTAEEPEESMPATELAKLEEAPLEVFRQFYELRNGRTMSEEQKEYMAQMAETILPEGKK